MTTYISNSRLKAWICILLLAVTGTAMAQESINETKQVDPDGYVRINLIRGELIIEGWNKSEIKVSGDLDEQMERFIFDVRGKETVIAVKLPQKMRNWCCDDTSDLTIKVPKNSNLVVSSVSVDVEVSDVHGGVEIGSVSGDLRVDNVSDRVRLTNVSGEIALRHASGRVRVKSVSGDIDANNISGPSTYHSVSGSIIVSEVGEEIDLESVSGDIEVTDSKVLSIRGHTVSGDVDVDVELKPSATVEFDSMSGTVRLALGGSLDARYDVQTSSGSIRNRITSDRPKESKYVRDEILRFVVGSGNGEVIVTSGSGDISLNRN